MEIEKHTDSKQEGKQDGVVVLRKKFADMTDEELLKYLEGHNKSDVYVAITECIPSARRRQLYNNDDLRDRYKAIKADATKSWHYDHGFASRLEVNNAVTSAYTILLRMIKVQQEQIDKLEAMVSLLEKPKTTKVKKSTKSGDTNGTVQ